MMMRIIVKMNMWKLNMFNQTSQTPRPGLAFQLKIVKLRILKFKRMIRIYYEKMKVRVKKVDSVSTLPQLLMNNAELYKSHFQVI